MDKKTMGSFLAALRKANGMTQQDVADILNVSNKTVSKWERDEGCPEIMMLPAIAELFGITVDELLRGERMAAVDAVKDEKAEKRGKYLFNKSSVKFTNYSIVTIVLGVVAVIISCLMSNFSYNAAMAACILAIILSAAGIIIEGIALNSFFSNIKSGGIEIDGQTLDTVKKKASLYLSLTVALTLTTVFCTVAAFISYYFTFVALMLGAASFAVIYPIVCKKFGVNHSELSPEFKKYRKNHIRITSITVAISLFVSLLLPFIGAAINMNSEISFSFLDGVGYQYETEEEAIKDYFKLRDYFVNGKKLYTYISEYPTENGYELDLEEIQIEFTQNENGYQVTSYIDEPTVMLSDDSYKEFYFETYEQAQNFILENVVNDYQLLFGSLKKDIRFDDETYTVTSGVNINYFDAVFDILPVFVLIGCGLALAETTISIIIYFVKKKKQITAGQ